MLEFNIDDYIGKKFSRLTITHYLGIVDGKRYCRTICECGTIKEFILDSVKTGRSQSCGCLRTESNKNKVHRATHNLHSHPLFGVWSGIKDRCYCITDKAYHNYGGSGVIMCEEWRNDFKAFYDWAIDNGWKKGLQIDKDKRSPYKTGLIYSPEYCCFLTRTENMRHRRNSIIVEYNNEKKCLSEWCELLTIDYMLVRNRFCRMGWTAKETFETPIRKIRRNTYALKINPIL